MNTDVKTTAFENAESEDELLLRRVAAGSEDSLKALYDRYAGLVHSVAFKMLGDVSEAEEVVQDVFVKVWRIVGSYDSRKCSAKGWLCMIARSGCLDRLRKRSVRPQLMGVDDLDYFAPEGRESSAGSEEGEKMAIVMKEMREEHRQCLELAYFKGYTQKEIAGLLGLPIGTVKTFMKRGMMKLRKVFTAEGGSR